MRRMVLTVVALVGCGTNPVSADTLPMIENLPTTYTPGQPFTFQLTLPAMTDFTSYSLHLVFTTQVQNPVLSASGAPATSNYPFAGSATFSSPPSTTSGNEVNLTISDSTSQGVTVTPPSPGVAGMNSELATITVNPDASLTGSITLSIASDSVFRYNTEAGSYDFPTNLPPIEQAAGGPSPVPAPTGALLFGVGGVLLGARRARER